MPTEIESRLDKLIDRIEAIVDHGLTEFEQRPVTMALKILLLLWCLRWLKRRL